MTRLAVVLDRFAAFIGGLVLIALGLALLAWDTDGVPGPKGTVAAPDLVSAASTSWWPWAVAAVGLLLVLIALRWLFTHTPAAKVKAIRLPSAAGSGSDTADLGAIAAGAARALKDFPEISSAKGRAVDDRGTRTIDLDVTAHVATNLTALIEPIDTVCAQVAHVVGDTTIATRTAIHIA